MTAAALFGAGRSPAAPEHRLAGFMAEDGASQYAQIAEYLLLEVAPLQAASARRWSSSGAASPTQ